MNNFTKPAKIFHIFLAVVFLTGGIAFLTGRTVPWQQPIGSIFNSFFWSAFLVFMVVFLSSSDLVRKNFQSVGKFRMIVNIIFAALLIGMFALVAYEGLPVQ